MASTTQKCFRCNEDRHEKDHFHYAKHDLWYCYQCRKVTTHKGHSCPFRKDPSSRENLRGDKRGGPSFRHDRDSRRDFKNRHGRPKPYDNQKQWTKTKSEKGREIGSVILSTENPSNDRFNL